MKTKFKSYNSVNIGIALVGGPLFILGMMTGVASTLFYFMYLGIV